MHLPTVKDALTNGILAFELAYISDWLRVQLMQLGLELLSMKEAGSLPFKPWPQAFDFWLSDTLSKVSAASTGWPDWILYMYLASTGPAFTHAVA